MVFSNICSLGFWEWLQDWGQVIAGLGSVLLSVFLVTLYNQQYRLRKDELNRDIRLKHTETIRERIRMWLGIKRQKDEESSTLNEVLELEQTDLPKVTKTGVIPAPPVPNAAAVSNPEFRVYPRHLEGDRYLKDFLRNHAPEVGELCDEIEELEEDTRNHREAFIEDFEGKSLENEEYVLSPTSGFAQWMFDTIVKTNREELKENVEETVEKTKGAIDSNDFILRRDSSHISLGPLGKSMHYRIENASVNVIEDEELQMEIREKLKEAVETQIRNVSEEENPYREAYTAAEKLDKLSGRVDKLKQILVEYEGRPLYSGDCKYLDEAEM